MINLQNLAMPSSAVRRRRFVGGLVVLVQLASVSVTARASDVSSAVSSEPSAEDIAAAKAQMREGVRAFRADDLEAARLAFERAWQLSGHAAAAASLAEVEMKLHRYKDAAEHWGFALERLPDQRAKERPEFEKQLAACRAQLGTLRVFTSLPGAIVYVDGEPVGEPELGSDLWVEPGRHVIVARNDRESTPEMSVVVVAGETQRIELAMPPAPAPRTANEPRVVPSSAASRDVTRDKSSSMAARDGLLLGAGAAALVAIGAGVYFVVKANHADTRADALLSEIERADPEAAALNQACSSPTNGRPPSSCALLSETRDKQYVNTTAATIAFISAGALAIGAASTYFLWPAQRPSRATSAVPTARVLPWFDGRTAAGASIQIIAGP